MTTVREFLTQAKDERRRLFFRPELGNAGDALINAGFYTLARRLGLDYVEITGGRRAVPELGREDLLILAGGGSLSSHWDIGEQTLDSLTCFDVPLLLLPQSLQGRENVLARLREQDTLFVREEYSLRYARSLHLACPVHLDHDMALSLDTALVLATPVRHLPRSRDDLRRAAAFARHRVRARRGLPLTAWRSDSEATSDRQARRRDDLSALADFGTLDRAANLRSARKMLEVISWYDSVETDRLHVGVGAALLGKPVTLHANAYHKIRGVYEYSLRDDPRYSPLVTYVEAPAA